MTLYPINLNIASQLCVVIGGGAVAARKITSLLLCDARVRVISPELSSGTRQLLGKSDLEWIARAYQTGDLQGARLAFALTDQPEVQYQISTEAQEQGIPINIADNPEACTFQTPATVRRGDLLISISTGGGSPALAATIRKELELQYGPEYGKFVTLLAEIRKLTAGQDASQEKHKALLETMLEANILSLLKIEDWQLLSEKLFKILPPEFNVENVVQKMRAH